MTASEKAWRKSVVTSDTPILKALEIIDKGDLQIAIVADGAGKLLGTLTDGDVRRALLRGISLSEPVEKIMNSKPTWVREGASKTEILDLMQKKSLRHIPLLDAHQILVRVVTLDSLLDTPDQENHVVLMAGGLGRRLSPLTDTLPKPMIPIGKKPILESILENFISQGFKKFYLSVNYKAEMIVSHFGDGSQYGCEIQYLHEKERLGTAGALSLIPSRPSAPLIIMNADILTNIKFETLTDFHKKSGADATMCVREYDVQIPYGVVTLDTESVAQIQEKPIQKFFVSAGIYVLNPDLLDHIKKTEFLDMPDFFTSLMKKSKQTKAYPIHEYWLDIGRFEDLDRANEEYRRLFGP